MFYMELLTNIIRFLRLILVTAFEYVHMMMAEIRQEGGKAFNGMIDFHNDFMRVYIEMGFWGFFAWGWYTLIFQYNWIKSKFDWKR